MRWAMFKTLAALRRDGRRHAAPVTPVHANDNRLDRCLVPRRAKRQVLRCRWRSLPATGRLECHWEIADIDDTLSRDQGGGNAGAWALGGLFAWRALAHAGSGMMQKTEEGPSCPVAGAPGAATGTPMGTRSEGRSAVRRTGRGRREP